MTVRTTYPGWTHDFNLPHILTANLLVPADPVADVLGFITPRDMLRNLYHTEKLTLPAAPYGKAGDMAYITGEGLARALRWPLRRYSPARERVAAFRQWVESQFLPDIGLECVDIIQGLRR